MSYETQITLLTIAFIVQSLIVLAILRRLLVKEIHEYSIVVKDHKDTIKLLTMIERMESLNFFSKETKAFVAQDGLHIEAVTFINEIDFSSYFLDYNVEIKLIKSRLTLQY